jgi:endoribonuclease Dicer
MAEALKIGVSAPPSDDACLKRTSGRTTLVTRSEAEIIADLKSNRLVARPNSWRTNTVSSSEREQKLTYIYSLDEVTEKLDQSVVDDGDNESDVAEEPVFIPKARKISERKRAQNAKFQSFYQDYATKQRGKTASDDVNEESQSTKWLVKQTGGQNIISSPRDYQVELFQKAKEENIIAVLDTGKWCCQKVYKMIHMLKYLC